VRQVLGKRVFRLNGEGVAIDDEQCPCRPIRLKEPLEQSHGGAGLAGAGRHLDKQLPPAADELAAQLVDAGDLIQAPTAPRDAVIDRDIERTAPDAARRSAPDKIGLAGNPSRLRGNGRPDPCRRTRFPRRSKKMNGTSS